MTRDGQNNLAEGEAEESNPFCVQGPDDISEPGFSGFRDDEIFVASNKGQVFSEFISSFDKQIDISKQGEKEKLNQTLPLDKVQVPESGFSCLMTTPLKLSVRRNSPKLIL